MSLETVKAYAGHLAQNIEYGIEGWVHHSPVTWISTAVAYCGAQLIKEYASYDMGEAGKIAKFVALGSTVYGIANGIFNSRTAVNMSQLSKNKLIYMTNAATLTLYGARYFGLIDNAFKSLAMAVISCGLVSMGVKYYHPETTKS